MKVFLLLAGRSRRFWPLQEKSLFPICGKPLLAHQIDRLRAAGCNDITLVAGKHNLEEARALFPDLDTIEQTDLDQGMQGALLVALPTAGTDSVMIISGNDVVDPDAYRMVRDGLKQGVDGVLLAKKMEKYFPGGYLTVQEGRIESIVEKPKPGTEPSDLVNVVVHAHRDASVLLKMLQRTSSDRDDGYEQAIDALCKGHHYVAATYEGQWQPVKYPWHLLALLPLLLADIRKPSIAKSAKVHPSAVIEGNVILENDVRVMPFATIVGPCRIGKGTIIGNGALVRGSSVGEGCVIGYTTEVKDSVLGDGVWMHMAYAGDSVVGNNVSFGAGAITGNLRLDEEEVLSAHGDGRIGTGRTKVGAIIGRDCRIGIHVGINPGVKIGSGSFVSSMTNVTEDVPDASFVSMKDGKMHVRENKTKAPEEKGREGFRKKL